MYKCLNDYTVWTSSVTLLSEGYSRVPTSVFIPLGCSVDSTNIPIVQGLSMLLATFLFIQQNFSISNFGISNFRFYRTTVNGPATINANKCIWLISNLGYIEALTPVP